MGKIIKHICIGCALLVSTSILAKSYPKPWDNGHLMVSKEHRYLKFENDIPFFWLGNTAWLLPERLNRDQAFFFLEQCRKTEYNVIQIQVLNDMPSYNCYGKASMHNADFDMQSIDKVDDYGYWDHMDYIIKTAENNGLYIGMVCIWGSMVKHGKMNVEQAKKYGHFLGERYKNAPNIIWIIGGDIRGDIKSEVWEALALSIKEVDSNHIMTFHPRGRTMSSTWFNNTSWLDVNMFQSGHRCYGQDKGDKQYPIKKNTEEDAWRYVEKSLSMNPIKPVLDGEPSYETIPQGLHDTTEPRWNDNDVRRYVYWSVFAGACGVTYGHNEIMQFYRPGLSPSYGAQKPWWDALNDPGFNQMRHLKQLMLAFPFFERIPDQSIIAAHNGKQYHRLIATRGTCYLLVYNYLADTMHIDLTKIVGAEKKAWWYFPRTGQLKFIGTFQNKITTFNYNKQSIIDDRVLIVLDATKTYINETQHTLTNKK